MSAIRVEDFVMQSCACVFQREGAGATGWAVACTGGQSTRFNVATFQMEEALCSRQAFQGLVIPLVQVLASSFIACYAWQQAKIARLQAARELSARYFNIYSKFSVLYNATLEFAGSNEKWKAAWFDCRNAKDEAACLYGLYHQGDNKKAEEINGLFESGMDKCLRLSMLIDSKAAQNPCHTTNRVAWVTEASWSQKALNELVQIKSELFKLMYDDIQLRAYINRASM